MEKDLVLAVGTISQALATFIKQELGRTNAAVHLLMEPKEFLKKLKSLQADIILLDVDYPTKEETAALVGKLQQLPAGRRAPLILIKPFFDELEEKLGEIPAERVLSQPFTREDLLARLRQVAPREIISSQEEETMAPREDELLVATGESPIIELTEVVEEGLPLEELPAATSPAGEAATVEDSAAPPAPPTGTDFPSDDAIAGLELPTTEEQGEDKDLLVAEARETVPAADPETAAAVPETSPIPSANPATATDDDLFARDEVITGESAVEPGPDVSFPFSGSEPGDGEPATAASTAAPPPPGTESPEDYLLPEEHESEKADATAPKPGAAPAGDHGGPTAAEPAVISEPAEPPFADQVEKLTQEWSQKMLASTFASMDKLIQALGEMAPTIVEQVAREIIPPLAEKIIKAEIQRLEAKIEEENQ